MKNDIFLWCCYRVKNWLKTVCMLKCKSTRLWKDNAFMPSNLHVFCGEPQHILWRHCWQHKTDMNLLKNIIIQNYARMKHMMLCQIKFGLLFKISNYHCCVFISRRCMHHANIYYTLSCYENSAFPNKKSEICEGQKQVHSHQSLSFIAKINNVLWIGGTCLIWKSVTQILIK